MNIVKNMVLILLITNYGIIIMAMNLYEYCKKYGFNLAYYQLWYYNNGNEYYVNIAKNDLLGGITIDGTAK